LRLVENKAEKVMGKAYPVDIYEIKDYGIEKWLNNYYVPVTGKEFNAIYDDVKTVYMALLKENQDNVVKSIALSHFTLIKSVSTYVYELLTLSRLKVHGYKFAIGGEKEEIPDNISMVQSVLSGNKSLVKGLAEITSLEKTRHILGTIKNNFKPLSSHGVSFIRNISNPYFFVGDRYQKEVVSFCDENNINPVCLPSMLFARNNNHYASNFKSSGLVEFVYDFLDIVRKQHPVINSLEFECLKKEINNIFRLSYSFFCQNVEVFSKFKPKKLLITGLGNPIHRIFCFAWRYAGGEVIGFTHGNTYSYQYSKRIFIELSPVDLYVSTSRGHKELINQAVKDFSLDLKNCEITYIKNNIYIPLFRKMQKDIPVKKIENIMVVGGVTKNYSAINTEYHKLSLLYNDIQLIKVIKEAGYYTIYKPRPETINETYGIFEMYADDVLNDKFEDVYSRADCLIFSSPYTTAFGFSLLSNKPIVLLNLQGYSWHPRAFELIKKRCSVVEAKAVDGKIVFNEQDVLDAVQESINNINYDILHEFAF